MDDKHRTILTEGTTTKGLRVFMSVLNPHSDEYRRYTVTLIENDKPYLCGEKALYKSRAAAKKIFNQVILAY